MSRVYADKLQGESTTNNNEHLEIKNQTKNVSKEEIKEKEIINEAIKLALFSPKENKKQKFSVGNLKIKVLNNKNKIYFF